MRKVARLRKKEDLPEWFNLAKYQGARELGAAGWFQQLISRMIIGDKIVSNSNEEKQIAIEFLKALLDQGILPTNYEKLDEWLSFIMGKRPTVDSMHCGDLVAMFQKVKEYPEISQLMEDGGTLTKKEREIARTGYDIFLLDRGLPRSGFAWIAVDLAATDKEIENAFREWLRRFRESDGQHREKMFSEADFRSWAHYQVLPYIDLLLWGRYQGVRYTNSLLADTLFPGQVVDSERIRKTIKPTADHLLDPSTLMALGLQAKRCMEEPAKNRKEKS